MTDRDTALPALIADDLLADALIDQRGLGEALGVTDQALQLCGPHIDIHVEVCVRTEFLARRAQFWGGTGAALLADFGLPLLPRKEPKVLELDPPDFSAFDGKDDIRSGLTTVLFDVDDKGRVTNARVIIRSRHDRRYDAVALEEVNSRIYESASPSRKGEARTNLSATIAYMLR